MPMRHEHSEAAFAAQDVAERCLRGRHAPPPSEMPLRHRLVRLYVGIEEAKCHLHRALRHCERHASAAVRRRPGFPPVRLSEQPAPGHTAPHPSVLDQGTLRLPPSMRTLPDITNFL